MFRPIGLSLAIVVMWNCAGCMSPQYTRYPTLAFGDSRSEKRAYEFHDPLPERESGPVTNARPRGFELDRSEPRRAAQRKSSPSPFDETGAPVGATPRSFLDSQVVVP